MASGSINDPIYTKIVGGGPFTLMGEIAVAADFPLLTSVQPGWTYKVTADVTDNDPTKTNTGQSFRAGDIISWTSALTWIDITGIEVWIDDGTDVKTIKDPRNVDLQTAGLKDSNVVTAVKLGSVTDTSLTTTKKDIIGAINEINSNSLVAVEDILNVAGDGQTAFTLSSLPVSNDAFALYLNGQLRLRGTDYTQSGTTLTWLDPGSLTLVTTDDLVARYNDTASTFINKKEVIVSKNFGDSPYNAQDGEVVFVDTSGGNVSIVLPDAATSPGVRIRVNKTTSDSNTVTINTTGGDTVGFQSSWSLSHQGDAVTSISDGVNEWCLVTERHAAGFSYFLPDHDANQGSHRVQNISGSGNSNFEFRVPGDFLSIISLELELTPSAGAAGSGKDIDLSSDYGTRGDAFNNHSETDLGTTYDFTGLTNKFTSIDLASVFSNIAANDICGVNVDHNSIGGLMSYYGIALSYRKKG